MKNGDQVSGAGFRGGVGGQQVAGKTARKTLEVAVSCLDWPWSRGSSHVIKVYRTKYTDMIQEK